MNYQERRRAITVGGFIAVGLLIFVVAVLALGGNQKRFVKSITLYTHFTDVSGLKEGNNVWFSGVKIGLVKAIQIVGVADVKITFDIQEESSKFIHKDADITIGSDGFIGNKTLVITAGSSASPAIQESDVLKSIIPLRTEDMMKTFQQNNENLVGITQNLKILTGSIVDGKGTVGALLTDPSVADNFRKILVNAQNASEQASKLTAELHNFSITLNNKDNMVHSFLTDTVIYNKMLNSAKDLKKSVADVNEITANAKAASEKLNSKNSMLGTLLNDEKSSTDLKSTLSNLAAGTDKLNQNMEALKHNFLFRGYFKKQEKLKADSLKNAN